MEQPIKQSDAITKSADVPTSHYFTGKGGPQRAVSVDGYDLVYHFPGAIVPKTLVSVSHLDLGFGG